MTAQAIVPRAHFVANGVQTAFGFTFPVFDIEDMEVWVDQDLRSRSTYSVSGIGVAVGGTVIFAVPPPASSQVTLRRRMALNRTPEFPDTAVQAKPLNEEFTYHTAALQQVADDAALAVKRSFRSLSSADLTLPEPVAGRAIRWNDAGDGLVNSAGDADAVLSQVNTQAQAAAASAVAASASQSSAAAAAAGAATAREVCDADVVVTGADRASVASDKAMVAADRLAAASAASAAALSESAAQACEATTTQAAANAAASEANAAADAATAQAAASAASASQSAAYASELSASGSASAAAASAAQAQSAAGVYTFANVAVAGQATVSAEQSGDTLTLAAGSALVLTTDAAADTVTIAIDQSGLNALIGLSSAGRALIDDVDAAAQRATLGLGSAATLNTAALHAMAAAFAS